MMAGEEPRGYLVTVVFKLLSLFELGEKVVVSVPLGQMIAFD